MTTLLPWRIVIQVHPLHTIFYIWSSLTTEGAIVLRFLFPFLIIGECIDDKMQTTAKWDSRDNEKPLFTVSIALSYVLLMCLSQKWPTRWPLCVCAVFRVPCAHISVRQHIKINNIKNKFVAEEFLFFHSEVVFMVVNGHSLANLPSSTVHFFLCGNLSGLLSIPCALDLALCVRDGCSCAISGSLAI